MRKFIKKYYIQLITIVILFILAIIMFLQSFNVRNMIREKSKELKQMQLDYALGQAFLRNSYEFKKNAEYIGEDNEWLSVFLPNDDDEKVKLFSTLEQLSEDTGNKNITISVVDINSKTKQKKATKKNNESVGDVMSLNVVLVGDYDSLIYFLQKIENMRYFADVKSLNIIKASKDIKRISDNEEVDNNLQKNLLQATMNIIFYLEK